MKRLGLLIIALILFVPHSAAATEIKEVVSPGGIRAWLVEDHKLPLIAMKFAFRGGVEEDPVAKQGLATLTMGLLTQGAGPYDPKAFQQQLADHSIAMRFSAGRDALEGSVKTLREEKDTAFHLLRLALTAPLFSDDAVGRLREQQLAAVKMQVANPGWQARYALYQYIFADHPYNERSLGSTQTIAAIGKDDIRNFATHHLAQDNLVVSVAGDIAPDELASILDQVFGGLPHKAQLAEIGEIAWPAKEAAILVPREGTQTDFLFAMPGPKLKDKDWYAAQIANYILGGGGFSSRLMQDVRDKKGLTYGISTGLGPMEHGGLITGELAADNPKAGQAWDIALNTMRRFYEAGVNEKEIEAAKDFLTGSLPLAMTSTDKIANVLTDLQLDRRERDYLNRRNTILRQVSAEEVNAAIRRWFDPARLNVSMVGRPEGMTATQTREQTRN